MNRAELEKMRELLRQLDQVTVEFASAVAVLVDKSMKQIEKELKGRGKSRAVALGREEQGMIVLNHNET